VDAVSEWFLDVDDGLAAIGRCFPDSEVSTQTPVSSSKRLLHVPTYDKNDHRFTSIPYTRRVLMTRREPYLMALMAVMGFLCWVSSRRNHGEMV
jgi:hypothetical protein